MIGIFDSGVGGLTVVKEIKKQLPDCSFIYLGDNARTPYGTRSQEIVQKYSCEDAEFLLAQGATAIIIACNTASALAGQLLQEKYPIPIFEVITPTAAAAAQVAGKRVGIIGTKGTIANRAYEAAIKKFNPELEVFAAACPLFVPLVEEGWAGKPETKTIARKYIYPLRLKQIDTLIMGCTHYPLLREVITEKIGRRVRLVDPAEEIVKQLKTYLAEHSQEQKNRQKYFITDYNSSFKDIARKWLTEEIEVEKADL